MLRPVNISFLTKDENACMELLIQAQDLFDKICDESPQNSTDAFNFGRYLDSARNSLLIRGARRMDADNLLTKHSDTATSAQFFDVLLSMEDDIKGDSK